MAFEPWIVKKPYGSDMVSPPDADAEMTGAKAKSLSEQAFLGAKAKSQVGWVPQPGFSTISTPVQFTPPQGSSDPITSNFSGTLDDMLKQYAKLQQISSGEVSPATELANKNKALSSSMTASTLAGMRGNTAGARNVAYGGAESIARIQNQLPEQIQAQKQQALFDAAGVTKQYQDASSQYLRDTQDYQGALLSDTMKREQNRIKDQQNIAQKYQDYLNIRAQLNAIESGAQQADALARQKLDQRLTQAYIGLTQATTDFAKNWLNEPVAPTE